METSKSPTTTFILDLRIPDVSDLLFMPRIDSAPVRKHLLDWFLSANIDEHDGIKSLAISLRCTNKTERVIGWPWECVVGYKMILKNQKGEPEKDHQKTDEATFTNRKLQTGWGYRVVVGIWVCKYDDLIKEANGFVLDKGIHIQMDVIVHQPTGLHFAEKSQIVSTLGYSSTATTTRHLLRMLESGEWADVAIRTKDKIEMKAHLGVLKDASPVFASMFEGDMTEGRTRKVAMQDIHASGLKALLRFLYTGDCSQLEDLEVRDVKELINAGEKYGLPDLKKYCGYLLVERASFKNALKLHHFAKKFGLEAEADEIFGFAKDHLKEVWDQHSENLADSDSSEEEGDIDEGKD